MIDHSNAKEVIWQSFVLLGRLIPAAIRKQFCRLLFAASAGSASAACGCRELILLLNDLQRFIDQTAMRYENGVHPKHRIMDYHRFFTECLSTDERVLDIGCGMGAVAYSMVVTGAYVTGIDKDPFNIDFARGRYSHTRLKFIAGDVVESLPDGVFDTIVMSNVLEHIENRKGLLIALKAKYNPKKLLIRVPTFKRHWLGPFKKELGLPYFSDPTHCIEYSIESFRNEITSAGLKIRFYDIQWGEIWADVVPQTQQ